MSLQFEGETLNIGGFEITGTVLIEANRIDASFSHEFGTEKVFEDEFTSGGFVPDADGVELDALLVDRAVNEWADKNEAAIYRAIAKNN